MRNWLLNIMIRLLERDLAEVPPTLTKDAEDGLLAQMWENPSFRKRIADRDKRIIYTLAGGEGMAAEPRDKYLIHTGQRVEVLLWARDAKAAYNRVQAQQKQKALAKEQEQS